jgi:hypothetical protein
MVKSDDAPFVRLEIYPGKSWLFCVSEAQVKVFVCPERA